MEKSGLKKTVRKENMKRMTYRSRTYLNRGNRILVLIRSANPVLFYMIHHFFGFILFSSWYWPPSYTTTTTTIIIFLLFDVTLSVKYYFQHIITSYKFKILHPFLLRYFTTSTCVMFFQDSFSVFLSISSQDTHNTHSNSHSRL